MTLSLQTQKRQRPSLWAVIKYMRECLRGPKSRPHASFAPCYALMLVVAVLCVPVSSAHAEKIENPVAVFAALNKVTARISHLRIRLGETVQFGALKITPRVCYTRPPTEPPLTSAFIEVVEIKLNKEEQKIFSGWMFAHSPGLHAVEHPVFDVWLTNCSTEDGSADAGNPQKSALTGNAASNNR